MERIKFLSKIVSSLSSNRRKAELEDATEVTGTEEVTYDVIDGKSMGTEQTSKSALFTNSSSNVSLDFLCKFLRYFICQ